MFLIDSAEAARDWDGIIKIISTIMERAQAEVVSMHKWDERPLAYKVSKCIRGTYILVHFRADAGRIAEIEREVQLSERILRVLILRADHLSEQDLQKETPAMRVERQQREGIATTQHFSPHSPDYSGTEGGSAPGA
jgi:ribosomal protein S6